jgi:RNA:NAD 2'-phosphotransferase (TPT1/KptA family)
MSKGRQYMLRKAWVSSGLTLVWGRLSTEEHRAGTKESTGASANPHATQPVYLAVDITKIQKQGLSRDILQLTVTLVSSQKVESIQMFSGRWVGK